jgi:hypothetical protein
MQTSDVILKRVAQLHHILYQFIPENNAPFRPAVTEELRGNKILARLLIKTIKYN